MTMRVQTAVITVEKVASSLHSGPNIKIHTLVDNLGNLLAFCEYRALVEHIGHFKLNILVGELYIDLIVCQWYHKSAFTVMEDSETQGSTWAPCMVVSEESHA